VRGFVTAVKSLQRVAVALIFVVACAFCTVAYAHPGGSVARHGSSPLNSEQQARQLEFLRSILCWSDGTLTFVCTCGKATYKGRVVAKTVQQVQKIQIDVWNQETPSAPVTYVIDKGITMKIFTKQGEKLAPLGESSWLTPPLPGMLWTPYDSFLPFLAGNAAYAGVKTESRSFHQWIFSSKDFPRIEVSVDASLNIPSRITFFSHNQPPRILNILKLKKFNQQWLPQSISLTDTATQTTARLEMEWVKN
jgi:hypothetical protein